MPTSDINSEMRQAAEYAARMARERFGKELDYSIGSLPTLEDIMAQAHQQYNINKEAGKIPNDTTLNRTASVWGSYLGELLRGKFGGDWIMEESRRWLVVKGLKVYPIDYVYNRIAGQNQVNIQQYFDSVAKDVSSQSVNIIQPQNISNNKNKISSLERILQIVLGVGVLILMCLVASWFYSSIISASTNASATQHVDNIIATINRVNNTPTTSGITREKYGRRVYSLTNTIPGNMRSISEYFTAAGNDINLIFDPVYKSNLYSLLDDVSISTPLAKGGAGCVWE